ncbi:MAG: ABC transporter permease [Campylobacterota bacterium]|nr:ABC transporter permease [Campylobacterota bacterium]
MTEISLLSLLWIFIPIIVVYFIYYKWNDDKSTIPYALSRMFLQLILIGYVLSYIFETKDFGYIILILTIMLFVASFIAMRPVASKDKSLYLISFIAISIGGVITLSFVVGAILDLEIWYEPRYIIPLAGMIFANSMNSVSIGAERFESEYQRDKIYKIARNKAYKASLIPNINSLFAVGLVSIPGMMTGQILAGVSPLIAVKYQIMVMCMIIASSGISTAIYLKLIEQRYSIKNK